MRRIATNKCAFSVSASSKRCVLESYQNNGKTEYQCRTSDVGVDTVSNHIENDQCVDACGVDRKTVGISSDALLEPSFVQKLCSAKCFQMCPNVIDLYYNLAAAEGVHLPDLCHASKSNPTRAMTELMSSGSAPGPSSSDDFHVTRRTSLLSPNGTPAPDSEYSNQVSDSSPYYNAPANAPANFDPDMAPASAPGYSDEIYGSPESSPASASRNSDGEYSNSPGSAPASAPGYSNGEYSDSPDSAPASAPGYSDEIYGSPESSPASAPRYSDGEYSNSPGSAPASAPGYSNGEYSDSPDSAPASTPGYSDEIYGSPESSPVSAPRYSDGEYSNSPGSAPASAPGYSNGEYSDSPDSAPASAPGYSGDEYSDSPGSASAPDSGIFDSLCRDCL